MLGCTTDMAIDLFSNTSTFSLNFFNSSRISSLICRFYLSDASLMLMMLLFSLMDGLVAGSSFREGFDASLSLYCFSLGCFSLQFSTYALFSTSALQFSTYALLSPDSLYFLMCLSFFSRDSTFLMRNFTLLLFFLRYS